MTSSKAIRPSAAAGAEPERFRRPDQLADATFSKLDLGRQDHRAARTKYDEALLRYAARARQLANGALDTVAIIQDGRLADRSAQIEALLALADGAARIANDLQESADDLARREVV